MLLISGLVLTTHVGQILVGKFLFPLSLEESEEGIKNAGIIIGNLERGLTYLAVLTGQPQIVGFLIAAKAILGFGTAPKNRKTSEYLIIGTLLSFGWAIAVSMGVLALRNLIT